MRFIATLNNDILYVQTLHDSRQCDIDGKVIIQSSIKVLSKN